MRKLVSCGLVMAMTAMGVPVGVSAAAVKGPAARQAVQTGTVKGEAKDEKGRKLAGATVRARHAATGAISSELVTDATGGFVATLAPGSYVFEVVGVAGHVIGLSPAIAVVAGTTATITVTATAVGAVAAAGAAGGVGLFGLGTAASFGVLGGAALLTVVGVRAAMNDASPSRH